MYARSLTVGSLCFLILVSNTSAQSKNDAPDLSTGGSYLACLNNQSANVSNLCNLSVGMYALGYVTGVRAAKMQAHPKVGHCIPDSTMTPNVLAAIVAGEIRKTPMLQHLSFSTAVGASLISAFPCLAESK